MGDDFQYVLNTADRDGQQMSPYQTRSQYSRIERDVLADEKGHGKTIQHVAPPRTSLHVLIGTRLLTIRVNYFVFM